MIWLWNPLCVDICVRVAFTTEHGDLRSGQRMVVGSVNGRDTKDEHGVQEVGNVKYECGFCNTPKILAICS